MIRENGVRLVHITGQHCEATPLLKKIERPTFFHDLPKLFSFHEDAKIKALSYEEKMAFDAIRDRYDEVGALLKNASIGLHSYGPQLKTAFRSKSNTANAAAIWHTDAENVISICLDGTGTEYIDGMLTPQDVARIQGDQILPNHVKIGQSGPGDILLMKGWWSCKQQFPKRPDRECEIGAMFHRAGSAADRRTVLFDTIGWALK